MANQILRNREKKKAIDTSKIFVIDLDGTICDIDSAFFKTAFGLSYFGNEVPKDFLDEREYITLADCGIVSEDDETRILALFDVFKVWETLDIFPGVLEFIQKISSSGASIVYLTSRRNELRLQTTNWLKTNGLPRPPDFEFGNEDVSGKVTLMMNGHNRKTENLNKICKTDRQIYYFENDPFHVENACKIGVKNIYTFEESYSINKTFSSKVTFLKKPRLNAYAGISNSIFK